MSVASNPNVLQNTLINNQTSFLKRLAYILVGLALLIFASKLYIPFKPIPVTFESTTVILIGMAYGWRDASLVVLAFLLAGICGLPIFTSGPTAGYLIGFLPAVYVSGLLAERGFGKNMGLAFLAALIADSIIFLTGVSWLVQFMSIKQAIAAGFLPFIITEPMKLIAVSTLIPRVWKNK